MALNSTVKDRILLNKHTECLQVLGSSLPFSHTLSHCVCARALLVCVCVYMCMCVWEWKRHTTGLETYRDCVCFSHSLFCLLSFLQLRLSLFPWGNLAVRWYLARLPRAGMCFLAEASLYHTTYSLSLSRPNSVTNRCNFTTKLIRPYLDK